MQIETLLQMSLEEWKEIKRKRCTLQALTGYLRILFLWYPAEKLLRLFVCLFACWGDTSWLIPSSLLSWKMMSTWISCFVLAITFGDLFRSLQHFFPPPYSSFFHARFSQEVLKHCVSHLQLWKCNVPLAKDYSLGYNLRHLSICFEVSLSVRWGNAKITRYVFFFFSFFRQSKL